MPLQGYLVCQRILKTVVVGQTAARGYHLNSERIALLVRVHEAELAIMKICADSSDHLGILCS